MENEIELAGIVHVGGEGSTDVSEHNNEPSVFPEHLDPSPWKRLGFVFHNFHDLPAEGGASVTSDALDCHGYKWRLRLYPGGYSDDCFDRNTFERYVCVDLRCGGLAPDEEVHAQFCMRYWKFGSDQFYISTDSGGVVVFTAQEKSWGGRQSLNKG